MLPVGLCRLDSTGGCPPRGTTEKRRKFLVKAVPQAATTLCADRRERWRRQRERVNSIHADAKSAQNTFAKALQITSKGVLSNAHFMSRKARRAFCL